MDTHLTFIFYAIISILAIIFMHLSMLFKKKNNLKLHKLFLLLSFVTLLLVNIFRSSSVGTDYIKVGENYTKIVQSGKIIERNYNWFGIPLSFLCLCIGKIFGSNPIIFYTLIGFLTLLFMYKFFINCCKYPTTSLSIYICFCFYLQSFNQSRQMLALAIVLYSLKFIKKNNLKSYIFYILFASVFHVSALIFIPLYFLKNIKISKKIILLYLIGNILLLSNFGLLEKIISLTKYDIYFTTIYNKSNLISTYLNLAVRLIILLFVLLFKKKLPNDSKYNFLYNIAIICTILQTITIKYYFIGRLTTYFYAFYIVLLPDILNEFIRMFKENHKKFVVLFIGVGLISYYSVYYLSPSGSDRSGYGRYSTYLFNS